MGVYPLKHYPVLGKVFQRNFLSHAPRVTETPNVDGVCGAPPGLKGLVT